jgi:hypothetical protein
MRQMRLRTTGVVLAVALLAAACGASSSAIPITAGLRSVDVSLPPSAATTPSVGPSLAPTPGPSKGPATATFALTGTTGLTGGVTVTRIVCGLPSLAGPEIEVLGTTGSGPGFVAFVSANHIEARVAMGDGPTLKLRTFVGSGVTSFDPSAGTQLDSDLTESTAPGSAVGTLGALSHLSGTIDCGNQQAGSAMITITGTSKVGAMSGQLSAAKVTCTVTASGTFVTAQALTMAGTTPVLVFVNAGPTMLQVVIETGTAADVYALQGATASTISPTGAQFSADLTETGTTDTPPRVLHIEGSDTCGTIINQ